MNVQIIVKDKPEEDRVVDGATALVIKDERNEFYITPAEDGSHIVIDVMPLGENQGIRYRIPPSTPLN